MCKHSDVLPTCGICTEGYTAGDLKESTVILSHNPAGEIVDQTTIVGDKKPREPKPKTKQIIKQDPAVKLLAEILDGVRCSLCVGLRSGSPYRCPCERAAVMADTIDEIEDWANQHEDSDLARYAANGAESRAMLRGGVRGVPSGIDGLTIAGFVGLSRRVEAGKAMEYKPFRKSGDELPV